MSVLISDDHLRLALHQVVASTLASHDHDRISMAPSSDGIERVSEQVLVNNYERVELLCRISQF